MRSEPPTPLAKDHWVRHDPRPLERAATRAWSELVSEHLPCYDLIELVNAATVLARDGHAALLLTALGEVSADGRRALEAHEAWRDEPAAARSVSLDEQRLLAAVHAHGAAIDSALGLLGARLAGPRPGPAPVPASPKLYPAVLLERLSSAPFAPPRANPRIPAIAERVARRDPDAWRTAIEALGVIASERASGAWPHPTHARHAADALATVEASWEREGLVVLEAQRRAGAHRSSGERRDLAQALRWCTSTRQILTRLSSELGWLRLILDYLMEIRRGAERIIDEARPDAPTSTFIDVVMHELAHALAVVDADPLAAVQALVDRDAGGEAARARLSRGRERCLSRWHLIEPDPVADDEDFANLLRDFASIVARHAEAGA